MRQNEYFSKIEMSIVKAKLWTYDFISMSSCTFIVCWWLWYSNSQDKHWNINTFVNGVKMLCSLTYYQTDRIEILNMIELYPEISLFSNFEILVIFIFVNFCQKTNFYKEKMIWQSKYIGLFIEKKKLKFSCTKRKYWHS